MAPWRRLIAAKKPLEPFEPRADVLDVPLQGPLQPRLVAALTPGPRAVEAEVDASRGWFLALQGFVRRPKLKVRTPCCRRTWHLDRDLAWKCETCGAPFVHNPGLVISRATVNRLMRGMGASGNWCVERGLHTRPTSGGSTRASRSTRCRRRPSNRSRSSDSSPSSTHAAPSSPGRQLFEFAHESGLAAAVRALGLERVWLHLMRHIAATRIGRAGATLADLMGFGGWASRRLAMRFTHKDHEQRLAPVNRAATQETHASRPPAAAGRLGPDQPGTGRGAVGLWIAGGRPNGSGRLE